MGTPVTREAVAAALYALVSAAAGKVTNLKTSGRRWRSFTDVDPAQMPALFQVQRPEKVERGPAVGLPPKRTMRFDIGLYTADAQADDVVPATQLNNMVDAIEAALKPHPVTGLLSIAGALSARIDGSIEYFENITNDGKSVAVIPIEVILP